MVGNCEPLRRRLCRSTVRDGRKKLVVKSPKSAAVSLETSLWEASNQLRSNMDAAEFKHVVLGLIFMKYVSDVFMRRRMELENLTRDPGSDYFMPNETARLSVLEDRDEYTAEGVFWISEGHRWDDLRSSAKQPNIGSLVDEAMDSIERENPSLRGVLPKSYARRELTPATLGGLIDTFSREDLAVKADDGLDVLGRVFEYMLGQFASAEGKLGGEFFTPRSVVTLLVDMLEPFNGQVYDPACGSGGMFVQADRFVKAHGGVRNDISVFGQEQNPTTWRLAKMNLALRGIDANLGPQWGDSFANDLHAELRADFVITNPPFNIKHWGAEGLRDDVRWKYGVPPASNANFAWIQHMLHHLKSSGTMATVLSNGSLSSQSGGEADIRKSLVENDLVECIVSLPGQLFYTTQIPVCLWFLTKDKSSTVPEWQRPQRDRAGEVLFIDARSLGEMVSRTNKELSPADTQRIVDTFHAWRGEGGEYDDVPGFCASVTRERICEEGYILTPGRFVGVESPVEDGEPTGVKLHRIRTGVEAGFANRAVLQARIVSHLEKLGTPGGS